MTRNTKLVLMFSPFILFFAGLAILVNDLRHPAIISDHCTVTGTGADAQRFKTEGKVIYSNSANPLHDVSLQCEQMGTLLLNDTQLFITPVKQGQDASISKKTYHYMPDRWMVSVHTGKPEKSQSAAIASPQ